jgi:hypothetical protein
MPRLRRGAVVTDLRINQAGGVAFVARDLRDVAAGLKPTSEEPQK